MHVKQTKAADSSRRNNALGMFKPWTAGRSATAENAVYNFLLFEINTHINIRNFTYVYTYHIYVMKEFLKIDIL